MFYFDAYDASDNISELELHYSRCNLNLSSLFFKLLFFKEVTFK